MLIVVVTVVVVVVVVVVVICAYTVTEALVLRPYYTTEGASQSQSISWIMIS